MAEKSKRSKKKSKDYDSDSTDEEVNTYVKKEIDKAMKQVGNHIVAFVILIIVA